MTTTWADVLLGLTHFCLAFLVPFVIFVAVVIVTKIKPTPLVVAAGLGAVVFTAVLLLLPMDPRSRQYSWFAVVTIALLIGGLFFIWLLGAYHLQSRLRLPDADKLVEKLQSRLGGDQNESLSKDSGHIEAKSTDDEGPSE